MTAMKSKTEKGPFGTALGPFRGIFGTTLATFWTISGSTCGQIEVFLDQFGVFWGLFFAFLFLGWVIFGDFEIIPRSIWGFCALFGPFWVIFEVFCILLRSF